MRYWDRNTRHPSGGYTANILTVQRFQNTGCWRAGLGALFVPSVKVGLRYAFGRSFITTSYIQ